MYICSKELHGKGTIMVEFNTALVSHETDSYDGKYPFVRVMILDGEDISHAVIIDRPGAARALIAAAQEYLSNIES